MRNFNLSQIKINKKLVAVTAVIIVLVTALAASLVYLGKRDEGSNVTDSGSNRAVVYKKADGTYLSAAGKLTKLNLDEDYKAEITDDGKYLIYTKPSAKISKKYDIFICDLQKASKVKKGPVLTDYGVEASFKYSDGSVYYVKQNLDTDAYTTYRYDIAKKDVKDIDFNIDDIFLPEKGKTIYYTRTLEKGSSLVLYSYTAGEAPKEIENDVKNVHFYDDGKNFEILYEVEPPKDDNDVTDDIENNTEGNDLYKVSNDAGHFQIATNVTKVMYDDYKVGGNLYYFIKNDVPTDWRGLIEDDMAESDKAMKKPNKDDYRFIFGISIQYTVDVEKYDSKLLRDEIREYLDEKAKKDFFKDSYSLYVKMGETGKKLADGVDAKRIYALAAEGEPRVIYSATQLKPSGKKISSFTDNIEKRNFKLIEPDVKKVLEECIVETQTAYASASGASFEFKNYDAKMSDFIMTENGKELYVISRDSAENETGTLFKHTIDKKGKLSEPEQISKSVKQAKIVGEYLWYIKFDSNDNLGDLQCYKEGVNERIESKVYSFTVYSDEDIIIYKNYVNNEGTEMVSVYACDGEKTKLVSNKVSKKQMIHTDNGLLFIRDETSNGGELCSYKKNKLSVVDKKVYSIVDY